MCNYNYPDYLEDNCYFTLEEEEDNDYFSYDEDDYPRRTTGHIYYEDF